MGVRQYSSERSNNDDDNNDGKDKDNKEKDNKDKDEAGRDSTSTTAGTEADHVESSKAQPPAVVVQGMHRKIKIEIIDITNVKTVNNFRKFICLYMCHSIIYL